MATGKKIMLFFAIIAGIYFRVCEVGYGTLFLANYYFPAHYGSCGEYTKRLNGGMREVTGEKLNVTLCGEGGGFHDGGEMIRLQVHSLDGALLAERFFLVHWEEGNIYALHYYEDHLTYLDALWHNDGDADEKSLSMPPTLLDWVQARLPGLYK